MARRPTQTIADFPDLIAQWHPTKNGCLTPDQIAAKSCTRIWWTCPNGSGHEWQARAGCRTDGQGCPYCAGRRVTPQNCLAATHPEVAAQWHPAKNGSLTPNDMVAGSGRAVWWKCPVAADHEWKTSITCRTTPNRLTGCPCCSGHKIVVSNSLATTDPEVAAEWHPTKNGSLTPFDVVAGSGRKVWWQCPADQGHVWKASLTNRSTFRTGCPVCRGSKGEKAIAAYLTENSIPHKAQWGQGRGGLPRRYRFDFAVNRRNEFWLIEYHGEQHYRPINFGSKQPKAGLRAFLKVVRRDAVKERWCQERSKNLLVIPYWDFDRIDAILDEFFAGHTPVPSSPPELVRKYDSIRQRIAGIEPASIKPLNGV